MSWVEQTISEFGSSVGINALSLNDAGIVNLQFEHLGALYIERRESEILVYMVRQLDHPDSTTFIKALSACHHQNRYAFAVHAGLRGENQLVFLARIPESEFILTNLEQVLNLLDQIHNSINQ